MKAFSFKNIFVLSTPALICILSSLTYYSYYSPSICNIESLFSLISLFGLIYPILFFVLIGYCRISMKIKFYVLIPFLSAFALPFLMIFPTNDLRMKAMSAAAQKGNLLIAEIKKYKTKNGTYPITLTDLKLDSYHTGLCQYPSYEYSSSKKESGSFYISIHTGQGLLNWDELVYRPGGKNKFGEWDYILE